MRPAEDSPVVVDEDRAKAYDKERAKLVAIKDALHLLTRIVLSELPTEARVLCVGVGTGAELFDLADENPKWRFTAVDPAAAMLDVCRQQAEERGIASRCTFHEGYLSSLPQSEGFDGATCFLVSHFLTDPGERSALFAEIGRRLRPGGLLLNADISGDMSTPHFQSLLNVWIRMLEYSDMPPKQVTGMRSSLGVRVAVQPPNEIETMLEDSGLGQPSLFFQSLLIHAWFSRR